MRRSLRRARNVALTDARPPLLRLLSDCRLTPESDGRVMVAVAYDQQWRTLWKAQRDGLLDADQYLTSKGREFLSRHGVDQ